jgi:hypothetical protein
MAMVMVIIAGMTAGAVETVEEIVVAVAVVVIAGLVAAATAIVAAAVAEGAKRVNCDGITIKDKKINQKIILRCYNLKEPSIGKRRKAASVKLLREEALSLLVRML